MQFGEMNVDFRLYCQGCCCLDLDFYQIDGLVRGPEPLSKQDLGLFILI